MNDRDDRDWEAGPRVAAHPQVAELLAALQQHGLPAEVTPDNHWTGWHMQILGAGGVTVITAPDELPEDGSPIHEWLVMHFDEAEDSDSPGYVLYESDSPDIGGLVRAIVTHHRTYSA